MQPIIPPPDLSRVERAYSAILDATAKSSARTTYLVALQDAKNALAEVRGFVNAAPPPQNTIEAPPNFSALAGDPMMQAILERRWSEVQRCMTAQAHLAATVMMGGLLESLLLARMISSPKIASVYTAKTAPKDHKTGHTLPFKDWKLIEMVAVAHELGWILKSAADVGNVLRDFRNYIHPDKEFTDKITLQEQDTDIFWGVSKIIVKQVIQSVGKIP